MVRLPELKRTMKAKKRLFFIIIVFILFFSLKKIYASSGTGLGVCWWPAPSGLTNSSINWFYWGGGGGQDWKEIEAQKGVYNFTAFDQALANHFVGYPDSSFWLDVMTAIPKALPEWVKPTAVDCPVTDQTCNPYGYILEKGKYVTFAPWNTNYQNALRNLMQETANHIKSPQFVYRDSISAVIIMAGGPFGEMISWHDPSSKEFQQWLDLGYTDGVYKDALVNKIIPIYLDAFRDLNYPFVLQIGGGIYGQESLIRGVIEAIYSTYPEMQGRIYFKYNAWRRDSWDGDVLKRSEQSKHNIFRDVSSYTLVGFEPGDNPNNLSDICNFSENPPVCAEGTADSLFANAVKSIEYTNSSFFCFPHQYFQVLSSSQIAQIDAKLEGNPISSLSPLPTATPINEPDNCSDQKKAGDYNCDGSFNATDFDSWKADFTAGRTSLSYFEYWRRVVL